MTSKAALREAQRARVLEPADRSRQSEVLKARLLSLDVIVRAKAVALFVGVRHEPEMQGIFDGLSPRTRWLPRVVGPAALAWGRVDGWASLQPGRFGIPEPMDAPETALPDVDVVLVPGLAFDRQGGRLGWGRGYYDRALGQSGAHRVGLCLAPGLVDSVPTESHDVPMDAVVTPDATLFGENARGGLR